MARNRGTFQFAANFEVLTKAPLDARSRVEYYTDLIDPSTWVDDNNQNWLYTGAIVSVINEPSTGIYFLSNDASFNYYEAWIPAGMNANNIPDLKNIGVGDASVYAGDGNFRTIKAGPGMDVKFSPDSSTIEISTDAGLSAVNGGVWITDITPQSTADNVGDKVTSSDGVVLESCLSSTQNINVEILAVPGNTNYIPNVTLYYKDSSVSVSLTQDPDRPMFNGTVAITLPADPSVNLMAEHEDGAKDYAYVEFDQKPVITSAIFTGGYPSGQTELKENDTYDINIQTDVDVIAYEVAGYGAFKAKSETGITASDNFNVNNLIIANQGTTTTNQPLRVRVKKSTGTWSDWYTSSTSGSDGTDYVKLNNLYPTISIGSITYPASQQALKSNESATVSNTITLANGTLSTSYTSPNGDLTISNSGIYENSKQVTRLAGDYNISTNNFTITATRDENNAISSASTVVWISNTLPTLTVVNPATRLRSGGNDGTSAQNHTIRINSNQRLLSTGTVTLNNASGGGSWSSSSTFTANGTYTSFTNTLVVHDDNVPNTYNWGTLAATSLSGQSISSYSGASTYVIGGFVSRTITVAAFATSADINAYVTDYSKLPTTLNWTVKSLPNKKPVGETTGNQDGAWSINNTGINPTTINILDTQAANSSSQASSITIEETV